MDMERKPLSVIFWTSLLRKNSSEYGYNDFNDLFIRPAISLLDKVEPPRINEDIKRILQFSENCKVGNWYLYKNHIEIRIYCAILAPYKLPKFLTTVIFALEYIRQILNADAVNFIASKKKAQFKLRSQIGSFIVNNRDSLKEVSSKLSVFKFKEIFYWSYDPQGIIRNL